MTRTMLAATAIALTSIAAYAQEKETLSVALSAETAVKHRYEGGFVPMAFSEHPVVQNAFNITFKLPNVPGTIKCTAWDNHEIGTGSFANGMTETDGMCYLQLSKGRLDFSSGAEAWGYKDPEGKVGGETDVLLGINAHYATPDKLPEFSAKSRTLLRGPHAGGAAYALAAEKPLKIPSKFLEEHGMDLELTPALKTSYARGFFVFNGWLGVTPELEARLKLPHDFYVKGTLNYTRGLQHAIPNEKGYSMSLGFSPRKIFSRR